MRPLKLFSSTSDIVFWLTYVGRCPARPNDILLVSLGDLPAQRLSRISVARSRFHQASHVICLIPFIPGDEYSFYIGAVLHCSFSIYEVIIYAIVGKQWLFYLHHIVVLIVYFLGASAHQINFYLAWAGLVELRHQPLNFGMSTARKEEWMEKLRKILYRKWTKGCVPLAVGFLIKDMVLDPANTWDMSLKPHVVFAL
eukprot:1335646-Amorphochlora_amoeboformis.AAC.3